MHRLFWKLAKMQLTRKRRTTRIKIHNLDSGICLYGIQMCVERDGIILNTPSDWKKTKRGDQGQDIFMAFMLVNALKRFPLKYSDKGSGLSLFSDYLYSVLAEDNMRDSGLI